MNEHYPYRNPQQQADSDRQELNEASEYPGRHGTQGGHSQTGTNRGNPYSGHGGSRPDMAPGHDYPEQVWHPHHESNPGYDSDPRRYRDPVNRDWNSRGEQGYTGAYPQPGGSYGRERRSQQYASGVRGEFQRAWAGGGSPWSEQNRGGQPGDRSAQSGNRGRAPKGYIRSDERIKEDICERLMSHPYADASDVTIDVKEGIVTLEGTVEARHIKHEIENVAESCMGVKDIENHIRVSQGGSETPTGSRDSGSANEDAHFDPHARGAGVP